MCIDIREAEDGTLYFAIAGGPDVPRISPVAVDIVMDAIARHNASVRAGLGPTITIPLSATRRSFDVTSALSRHPTNGRASLPPVVRLPPRRRVPLRLRLVIAGILLFVCIAAFATPYAFTGRSDDPGRTVLFEPPLPPANALACITGPELE